MSDEALGAFVEAIRSGQIQHKRLYFDISGVLLPESASREKPGTALRHLADLQQDFPDSSTHLASRIREIGFDRVLFGTDWPVTSALAYASMIAEQLKLSGNELRQLLQNVAQYLN